VTFRIRFAGLVTALLLANGAYASNVGLDTWYQFAFDSNGGLATSCVGSSQRCLTIPGVTQAGAPQWAMPGPVSFDVLLIVTDSFQSIDLFEIIKNGQPLPGYTPPTASNLAPNAGPTVCSPADPMTCVGDPSIYSRMALFPAGSQISFDILVSQLNQPIDGSAFFLLTGDTRPVPEPSTWFLVGAGLALAALRRRR
jgi:hypothetical protein